MYTDDSFFTLSPFGQVGLVVLSFILAASTITILVRLVDGHKWFIRLGLAFIVFYAFIWLAPQLYYFYYVPLLGLPMQLVVQSPPMPNTVLKILAFQETSNLSYHAQGAFGWLLFVAALLKR